MLRQPIAARGEIARQFGFTRESFEAHSANQQVLDGIQEVRDRVISKLGVNSTPNLFVNGEKLVGGRPIDRWPRRSTPISSLDKDFLACRGGCPARGGNRRPSRADVKIWITRRTCCAWRRADSFSAPMRHPSPRLSP